MNDTILCGIIGGAFFWSAIGWFVGARKGQGTSGAVWGFLLGPFGLLVVAALSDRLAQEAEARALQEEQDEQIIRQLPGGQGIPKPPPMTPQERDRAALRARIEEEERIRAEVRAKIEAEERLRRSDG
jgi:hypothetical protein